MRKKMTKSQALESFKNLWTELLIRHPNYLGDSVMKRTYFNDYVDMLNKDGMITDKQAFSWSNPF